MYIYFDENGYVCGYGSEPEPTSIEVNSVPEEVDRCLGAYKYDNGQYIVNVEKKKRLEEMSTIESELEQLYSWFNWYDQQIMQYQRALRLGMEFDKDMEQLDTTAITYAKRITEIRNILSNTYEE